MIPAIIFILSGTVYSQNILVLKYDDFGPQAAAWELIGTKWWQWDSHGDSHPDTEYDINVVVYRGISLDNVKARYPVIKEKKQDYRYLEYEKAIKYFDDTIKENILPEVTLKIQKTRDIIINELGKDNEKTKLTDNLIKEENIYYKGSSQKEKIIPFIDSSLKKYGDFGVYGDLSAGLGELTQDCSVRIDESTGYYYVSIAPVSGDGGHDFSFKINMKTGEIRDVVVGEIEPEPEDE